MIGRTEIAAMALQGLLSGGITHENAARFAVEHADALLYELAKIPPPASNHESPKEGPPTGCSAGAAGDTKGAASPRAAEGPEAACAHAPLLVSTTAEPAASPVQVFDCEGRFPNDPPCPPTSFDAATKGRFCVVHVAVDEGTRREFHRLHGHRNRPATLAHRIAEAI